MASITQLRAPHKVEVYAEYGGGKTTFSTVSLVEYLRDTLKLKPEEVRIAVLDNDSGFAELVESGQVDPAYHGSFIYNICNDWTSLTANTRAVIAELKAWQAKHGLFSAWVVTDNVDSAYKWAQDDFVMTAYGKPMDEIGAEKRSEALSLGKKMLPTLPGMDWGSIGRKHAVWADSIKLSGLNFIWTAPLSEWTARDGETGEQVTTIKAKGQGDNMGRVSHILKLYTEQSGTETQYFADLEKNRGGTKLFKHMPNPTYTRFRKWVEKYSPAATAAAEAAAKATTPSPTPTTPAVQA